MALKAHAETIKRGYIKACEAVIGRGGSIATGAPIDELASAIYNIPADNAITTVTDNSTALVKTVPANSTKYAYLAEFGGMTYKCNNLFDDVAYFEARGWEKQSNGYYLASNVGTNQNIFINTQGTLGKISISYSAKVIETVATSGGTLVFVVTYTDGTTGYIGSLRYNATTYTTITASTDENKTVSTIKWSVQHAYTAEIKDVMLNFGEVLPYEPYFEGLRDAKVAEIVSRGANIWDEQTELGYWNGVDGGATQASNQIRSKNYIAVLPNTTYMNSNSFKIDLRFYDKDKRYIADSNSYSGAANSSFTTPSNAYYLKINLRSTYGTNYNNDIMLNIGSTIAPYTPYRAPISYPIPAEIQALEGYGRGVNDANYNYVDFENGVFVPNVREGDLGSYSWNNRQSNGRQIFGANIPNLQGQTSSTIPINALAADYRAVSVNSAWVDRDMSYNETGVGVQRIEIVDNRYTSSSAFKQGVSGKKLVYAVETATPISLSVDFSPLIEVESGGTIEFVNEHDYAVPSKIVYQTLTQ